MDMKKKEYTKPSAKLVEWNFSEAVCLSITTTSYTKCISVRQGTQVNQVEIRTEQSGEWNRVGSSSSQSW